MIQEAQLTVSTRKCEENCIKCHIIIKLFKSNDEEYLKSSQRKRTPHVEEQNKDNNRFLTGNNANSGTTSLKNWKNLSLAVLQYKKPEGSYPGRRKIIPGRNMDLQTKK